MGNHSQEPVMFFKVQYRDLGKVGERHKSNWYTLDGEIAPNIRSYEIPGLLKHHAYRFRIAAVIDNDNVLSKVSQRFRIEADTKKAPTVIPQIKHMLPLSDSDTALSVQWVLAENATLNDNIVGYFINFRKSSSAGPYNHLTIFGSDTHSHILDNLSPGESYDIKVRAFNLNGAGPFSKVRFARTNGKSARKTSKPKSPKKLESKSVAKKKDNTGDGEIGDSEARLYLIIGASLGAVCLLLFSGCMGLTLWRRSHVASKFSTDNANIHSKYQDTSLQINNTLYDPSLPDQDETDLTHPRHNDQSTGSDQSPIHETSFSMTDHSMDNRLDQYSQGSTIYMQV